jgi:hypothetical protein
MKNHKVQDTQKWLKFNIVLTGNWLQPNKKRVKPKQQHA